MSIPLEVSKQSPFLMAGERVFFFEMWFDISCIVLNAIPVHSFTDSESLSDISCLASRS